jgi:hypothetical protein
MMFGELFIGAVLTVFAAIISVVALKTFTLPYVWIAVTWAAVLVCAWVLAPRLRAAWLAAVAVVVAAALFESGAAFSALRVFHDVRSEGTFKWVDDDVLGYTAPKSGVMVERKFYQGRKIYDVVYSTDANGLRVTADTSRSGARHPCVVFFGDSATFGWGLNDQETLPYRLGAKTAGRYRSVNLAFLTHGPQQMLAVFEHNLLGKRAGCGPRDVKYVVYQATPDHVRRAAGLRDRVDLHHGPQYALRPDGAVTYVGPIGTARSVADKIEQQLSKSFLYRRLTGGDAIYTRAYRDKDLALYLAIVDQARAQLKALNPDGEFHVLLWENDVLDKDGRLAGQVLDGLKQRGLSVHRIGEILPGADHYAPEWFFGEFDLHPNAAANDRIAEYLARKVLR